MIYFNINDPIVFSNRDYMISMMGIDSFEKFALEQASSKTTSKAPYTHFRSKKYSFKSLEFTDRDRWRLKTKYTRK